MIGLTKMTLGCAFLSETVQSVLSSFKERFLCSERVLIIFSHFYHFSLQLMFMSTVRVIRFARFRSKHCLYVWHKRLSLAGPDVIQRVVFFSSGFQSR